jgi:hypothetical protein
MKGKKENLVIKGTGVDAREFGMFFLKMPKRCYK